MNDKTAFREKLVATAADIARQARGYRPGAIVTTTVQKMHIARNAGQN